MVDDDTDTRYTLMMAMMMMMMLMQACDGLFCHCGHWGVNRRFSVYRSGVRVHRFLAHSRSVPHPSIYVFNTLSCVIRRLRVLQAWLMRCYVERISLRGKHNMLLFLTASDHSGWTSYKWLLRYFIAPS